VNKFTSPPKVRLSELCKGKVCPKSNFFNNLAPAILPSASRPEPFKTLPPIPSISSNSKLIEITRTSLRNGLSHSRRLSRIAPPHPQPVLHDSGESSGSSILCYLCGIPPEYQEGVCNESDFYLLSYLSNVPYLICFYSHFPLLCTAHRHLHLIWHA